MIGNYESEFDHPDQKQLAEVNEFWLKSEEVLQAPKTMKTYKLPWKTTQTSDKSIEENPKYLNSVMKPKLKFC